MIPQPQQVTNFVAFWTKWLLTHPYGLVAIGILAAIVVLLLLWGLNSLESDTHLKKDHVKTYKPAIRWPWTKAGIPFPVGNVILDLQPRRGDAIHLAIGGTTGTGKTSSVLPLLDLPVGVLIIALDNTRPIATRIRELPDGLEWTNEPGCRTPWNILLGTPEIVSEALVAGWPRSKDDSGHFRRIARMRMWDRLEQADADGEVRSLPMLIDALMMPNGSSDAQVGRACRDWATKLAGMYRILGPSIGSVGDLDLVQAMRTKKKVLMRLNRFMNPEDAPTIGGMLLVHARRVAQEANVPFVLVVEEAGLLETHQEHIGPLAQASRDRNVSMIIITQNLSQLPLVVRNNVSAWISFCQEDDKEQLFAAKRLRIKPTQLWRESFKHEGRRWAYVRAPGLATQLVRVREFKPQITKPTQPLAIPDPVTNGHYVQELPRIDGWQAWTPALPEPRPEGKEQPPAWVGFDADMNRFWRQMRRTNQPTPLWSPKRDVWWDEKGCLQWMGPLSKHKGDQTLGRPRSNIGRRSVTVYIETAKAAGKPTEPTLDHLCDNPICCEPTHLEACSIIENNSYRDVRNSMLEKAWLQRYNQIPSWWQNRHHERVAA